MCGSRRSTGPCPPWRPPACGGKSGRRASVFDPRWIKPLPEAQLLTLAKTHEALLLVEENSLLGGFSSAVLELLADHDLSGALKCDVWGCPTASCPTARRAACAPNWG